MTRRLSRSSVFLTALASVAIATPAVAGHLVVRSTGPSAKSYPPGKQLPDSAKINLRPGDSITLLGPNSTRTLRGPGNFSAGGSENLALAANRRARFGALRSGELALNPSPWNVDVSHSGKVCVAQPTQLLLWRPNSTESTTLDITRVGGHAAKVDWPAGKATLAWPAQLPIEDGAEYQIASSTTGEVSTVSLATMPGIPEDMMTAAQALIERGCEAQLDLLVNGMEPDAP